MRRLRISENKRFLEQHGGQPFVWIGDTLWRWQFLRDHEQDEYLAYRRAQGFTVVQIRLGGDRPIGGEGAYEGNDITRPNETYWRGVDRFLARLADYGMYAAVVLLWGQPKDLHDLSAGQMYAHARWVGDRYKELDHIVWMTLGEGTHPRSPREVILAAVRGLRDGDSGHKLLTVHAHNQTGTSLAFHDEVDFNTWQTSQFCAPTRLPNRDGDWRTERDSGHWTVWEAMAHDWARQPAKPTLDAEAWYEGPRRGPGFADRFPCRDHHVRRRAYFTVFAGAFGHTYGAEGVWDVRREGPPLWRDALLFPGGDQMQHLRALLESRPAQDRLPDQATIVEGQSRSYEGHIQALRDARGSWAWIYVASGHDFAADLTRLSGPRLAYRWYDPRTGTYAPGGEVVAKARQWFTPPGEPGPENDWVLVVESQGPRDP